jgi:CHAD domain-containing protein
VHSETPIERFAAEQVTSRLGRIVFEVKRCGKSLDADNVHDLRVAIRRFNQSLRSFASLLPRGEVRRIRRQAKEVMELSSELRDRDVALAWLAAANVSPRSSVHGRIAGRRREFEKPLADTLRRMAKRDFSSRWRSRLNLDGA